MHQMILIGPVRASADCFTTCVGIRSSMQDLGLECLIVSLIEASVIVARRLVDGNKHDQGCQVDPNFYHPSFTKNSLVSNCLRESLITILEHQDEAQGNKEKTKALILKAKQVKMRYCPVSVCQNNSEKRPDLNFFDFRSKEKVSKQMEHLLPAG